MRSWIDSFKADGPRAHYLLLERQEALEPIGHFPAEPVAVVLRDVEVARKEFFQVDPTRGCQKLAYAASLDRPLLSTLNCPTSSRSCVDICDSA